MNPSIMSSEEEETKNTSSSHYIAEEMPGVAGSTQAPGAVKEGAQQIIKDGQRDLLAANTVEEKHGTSSSSSTPDARQMKDAQRALLAASAVTGNALVEDNNEQDVERKIDETMKTVMEKPDMEEDQQHQQQQLLQDRDTLANSHGGVTFPRPMPQPLPGPTATVSGGTRNSAATAPGAYAGDGRGPPRLRANLPRHVIEGLHYSLPAGDDEEQAGSGQVVGGSRPNAHALVQANPISEEEEAQRRQALPHAQKHDGIDASSANKKKTTALAVIAALVVLVLVVVVVVVVTVSKSDSTKATPTVVPSESPSAAPSDRSWLLGDLPADTLEAIVVDPDSYQAQAYEWLSDDPYRMNHSQARLEQRFALACIYFATRPSDSIDGEESAGWERSDGWLEYETHECDWLSRGGFGFESFPDRESLIQALIDFNGLLRSFVTSGNRTAFSEWEAKLDALDASQTCNEEGLYKNLFLYKNNLMGTVPNEVYTYLTNLQSLDLSWNSGLGGTISPDIGRLTNLEFLWLGYNAFTGELPLELADLSSLQIIHIVSTQVTGPIPSEIGRLTDLVFLSLTRSLLSSSVPDELSQLVYLMNLDLARSQLTGTIPSSLARISGLKTLRLFESQVSGSIPSELGLLQQLDIFDLSSCQLTSSIPSELGLLSNTSFLSVQQNQLTGPLPSELGLLEALVELLVYDNSLTGSLPPELYGLEQLTALQVHNNPLLGGPLDAPVDILDSMTSLKVLTLTDTGLSGELPQALCNASSLEVSFNCSTILCGCNCTCS